MLAIAIIPSERVTKYIFNLWKKIDKINNVNYVFYNSSTPHITLISGIQDSFESQLSDLLQQIVLDSENFELYTKGFGMLLLDSPLIYLRWRENQYIHYLKNKIQTKLELNGILESKKGLIFTINL